MPSLDHLVTLSDDVGVIQHAVEDIPNRSTGYCTDDVARAFIVAISRLRIAPDDKDASSIASTSLSFLHDAQLEDGAFHNFMSHGRAWLDEVGTPDSIGRAIWALGYGMQFAPKDSWRRQCARMVERALAAIPNLHYPRSNAYAALGLTYALAAVPDFRAAREILTGIAASLREAYLATRGEDWEWFEDFMTYDNARL
ncbi:MAG: glycosyl transferase, partial [Candidatus Eremiobacteraeota bacterium]|nr:glycosyl transferase [Candidatus Eremiobacteraeota bacterium]